MHEKNLEGFTEIEQQTKSITSLIAFGLGNETVPANIGSFKAFIDDDVKTELIIVDCKSHETCRNLFEDYQPESLYFINDAKFSHETFSDQAYTLTF